MRKKPVLMAREILKEGKREIRKDMLRGVPYDEEKFAELNKLLDRVEQMVNSKPPEPTRKLSLVVGQKKG